MDKVLLAIDGVIPDHKAFSHAVALCLRLKAEMRVLQIIRPQKLAKGFRQIKNAAIQARQYMESSMVAATFAEAGEYETSDALMAEALCNIKKLLPESEKAGVACHITVKSGDPVKTVVKYVREHKDVVVAIYDPTAAHSPKLEGSLKKNVPREMLRVLPVPVVMVQADS